jgi:hypothetical protein
MRRSIALLLAATACAHTDPYPIGTEPSDGPFDPSPPVQITFNATQDLQPSWLPDQSGVIYAFELTGEAPVDRCLGVLPAGGGTRRAEKCFPRDLRKDSIDALQSPAAGKGGRVAWVESHAVANHTPPDQLAIRVGSLTATDTGRIIRGFPYLAGSGLVHATATHLAWLSPDTLAYLGRDVTYTASCVGCKIDSLLIGGDIVLLDVSDPALTPILVAGTTGANSLAADSDGRTVYYTFPESSQVYRQTVDNGAVSIIHDFGIGRVVRDAQVVGNRLVAVVDGRYRNRAIPPGPSIQEDDGGVLVQVDLTSGIETPLPAQGNNLFKRPSLSPSGLQVVAEGYPFILNTVLDSTGTPVTDTLLSPIADLWLVQE